MAALVIRAAYPALSSHGARHMDAEKIKLFLKLAGHDLPPALIEGDAGLRELGAHLLLSEVLEYVIKGLGVEPEFDGKRITAASQVRYHAAAERPDKLEMLDGLADVAYTMYWNACAFGVPLEQAFDLVCDNNLEKFVRLPRGERSTGALPREEWHCGRDIRWPENVAAVEVVRIGDDYFAVGKDARGKVRKPSSYSPVDLRPLVSAAVCSAGAAPASS